NTASVEGDEPDPDSPNDEDGPDDPVIPVPQADLSIAKTVDNSTPTVGENVVFTLTVGNAGPSNATLVSAVDRLPSGYTYVGDNGDGAYVASSGVWTIGNLEAGTKQSLNITAKVNASGEYTNKANVDGGQDDPDPSNDEDEVSPDPVSINNGIVAQDDSYTMDEDTELVADVLANDSDPDGDNLIINTTPIDDVDHGTLVINANGTFSYTPDQGFVGTDTFIYEICDDAVDSKCDQATVTILINKGNSAPDPEADEFAVQNCIYMVGNVLSNDSDPDGNELVVGSIPVQDVENGVLVLQSDGRFTYTPNSDFIGTDSFTYQVCDDADNYKCAIGTVTINVIAPLDTDGDGLLDCEEIGPDPEDPIDTDGDGTPDFEDEDDDNDGILTDEELDDPEDDCDQDGIPNYLDDAQYSCDELPVTNTVTPNGDGYNDYLKILGLDEFESNEIVVYNRWGNIVFKVTDYVSNPTSIDSFTGSSNLRSAGKNLPDGTYFFVLKLVKDGKERVQKGSFEIRN
ncbi:MAG: Ig-like domain-containing protein, partial [Marinoscillum sp.]